jgi:hypothetical protein
LNAPPGTFDAASQEALQPDHDRVNAIEAVISG